MGFNSGFKGLISEAKTVGTTYRSPPVSRCSDFGFTTFSSARTLSALNISRRYPSVQRDKFRESTVMSSRPLPLMSFTNLKFIIISLSPYDSLAYPHCHYTKYTRFKEEMNTNSISKTLCLIATSHLRFYPYFTICLWHQRSLSLSLFHSLSLSKRA